MKYLYELIGTFFLVFTIGMTVLMPDAQGLAAPLAIGSILAVMVYAGAHVSGAHYNPAVSLAVFIRGKLTGKDMILYWIFQIVGSILAAYVTLYLKGSPAVNIQQLDVVKAFIVEFIFTFALCFVVLNVATAKATANNSYFGFAIGFTVLAGAYAVGAISGGAFNSAVAIGLTFMKLSAFVNLWIFIAANLLGGIAAALVFKAAHQEEA